MNEIANLQPTCIWRNFDALTKVPRPSGHLEKVQQFLLDFAKRVGVEGFIDEGNNVVMRKAATPGMENRKTVLLQAHMDKVKARLAEAVGNIDNDRLQQEFALFIQKSDVDEEFSRLRTHIAEVRRIVTEGKGSAGKRLDFLMQELNREANTLGSKAIAAECTQASVELKVLIEQMREQVQNIE